MRDLFGPEVDEQYVRRHAPRRSGLAPLRSASPLLAAFGDADPAPSELTPATAPIPPMLSPKIELAVSFLVLAGVGYLSYEIGSGLAPRGADRRTWGWVGVPLGLFTGPIGLGAMALVAKGKR